MSAEDDFTEGLMQFVSSVRTSMLYIARRLEALEASAGRIDPLFRIPALTQEEEDALSKAREGEPP